MPSFFWIHTVRWLSYVLLLVLVGTTAGLVSPYAQTLLTRKEQWWGVGVVALVFILWLWVQQIRDRWLVSAIERAKLSDDATFYQLYNNSPVAHLTLNRDGVIKDFNPAAVRLFKTNLNTLREQKFFSLCDGEFDTSFIVSKSRAGMTLSEVEVPLRTATNELVWSLFSVSALPRRREILVTLIDITEKKKVDTAKSEFVALATHQLRTPVAAIRYAAELLGRRLGEGVTDRNTAYLDKVNRNVVRMLALINDFLNVSKLEMGTFATEATSVHATTFISDILDEFSDRIANQKITLSRMETPADFRFMSDPRLLNIILSNLISNAVKYTPDGGTLEVLTTKVGSNVQFEIVDSGIGIPAEEIPQLFNKFFRASNARVIRTEGTGLGLYIVKQAVEQLGGTIGVTSDAGKGSRFTVTIPTGKG